MQLGRYSGQLVPDHVTAFCSCHRSADVIETRTRGKGERAGQSLRTAR